MLKVLGMAAFRMSPQSLVSTALLCLTCALVALAVAQTTDSPDNQCPAPAGSGAQSTCVCQTDTGQIIDLRPLANSNGTARYRSIYIQVKI